MSATFTASFSLFLLNSGSPKARVPPTKPPAIRVISTSLLHSPGSNLPKALQAASLNFIFLLGIFQRNGHSTHKYYMPLNETGKITNHEQFMVNVTFVWFPRSKEKKFVTDVVFSAPTCGMRLYHVAFCCETGGWWRSHRLLHHVAPSSMSEIALGYHVSSYLIERNVVKSHDDELTPTATMKMAVPRIPTTWKMDAQLSLWSPHTLSFHQRAQPWSGFCPQRPTGILTPASCKVVPLAADVLPLSAQGCAQQ